MVIHSCVSTVLCLILDSPEPWFGPVVCMKILGLLLLPSWAMMQLWTRMDTWLSLFSFSLSGLIPVAVGRAGSVLPPCLGYKYKLRVCVWLAGIFIAVLIIYKWRLGAMGAPYNGWAWMCCGLTMAGACAKHQPCYWSQTTIEPKAF